MMTAQRRPYAIWLERKFLAWQTSQDSRKTITEFAAFLGFSKQAVTNWLNDNRQPDPEKADQIATQLDFDVSGHPLLGFPEPDPDLLKIKFYWPQMSKQQRAEAKKLIDEIERRHEEIPVPEPASSKSRSAAPKRRSAES